MRIVVAICGPPASGKSSLVNTPAVTDGSHAQGEHSIAIEVLEVDDVYERLASADGFDREAWKRAGAQTAERVRQFAAELGAERTDAVVWRVLIVVDTLHLRSMRHRLLRAVAEGNATALCRSHAAPLCGDPVGPPLGCYFATVAIEGRTDSCLLRNRARSGRACVPDAVVAHVCQAFEYGPCRQQVSASYMHLPPHEDQRPTLGAILCELAARCQSGDMEPPRVDATVTPAASPVTYTAFEHAADLRMRQSVATLIALARQGTATSPPPGLGAYMAAAKHAAAASLRARLCRGAGATSAADDDAREQALSEALGELVAAAARFQHQLGARYVPQSEVDRSATDIQSL